jgi:hypothetical protein
MAELVNDPFTRANSTGLGANWTDRTNGWDIASNAAKPRTGGNNNDLATYTNVTIGTDQWAECTVTSAGAWSDYGPIVCWVSGGGGFDGNQWYGFIANSWYPEQGTGNTPGQTMLCQLTLVDSANVEGPKVSVVVNAGDVLRVERQGTTLKGFVNGVEKASTTISPPLTGGKPGLYAFFNTNDGGTAPVLDNFKAGDFTGAGVNGTLAITLDTLTAVSTATADAAAVLAQTLATIALVATATVDVQGVLAQTLGTLTSVSTATAEARGDLAQTLDVLTVVTTGTADVAGTLSQTLDVLGLVADGTVVTGAGTNGDLTQTLATLTVVSTGTAEASALVSVTLADVTAIATATSDIQGVVAQTLDLLTTTPATATVDVQGVLAQPLDALTGTGTAGVDVQGVATATLAPLTLTATGGVITGVDITTTTLPNAVSGVPYSQTILASGGSGTLVFTLVAGVLPPGLALAPTGALTGTPALLGGIAPASLPAAVSGVPYSQTITLAGTSASYPFTIRVTDDGGLTDTQAYTVGLSANPPTITLVSGALPPGLTLAASGALTGTPPLLAVIAPSALPSMQSGIPYSQQIGLVQGSATYAFVVRATTQGLSPPDQPYALALSNDPAIFTLLSGVLPPGITLSSTGLIAGTTSVSGGAPVLAPATLPPGLVDIVFTQLLTVTATGGASYPFTVRATTHGLTEDQAYTLAVVDWDTTNGAALFAVVVGRCPSCVSLRPGGLLIGPPMQVAVTTFTVRATDRVGRIVEQAYTLTVTS